MLDKLYIKKAATGFAVGFILLFAVLGGREIFAASNGFISGTDVNLREGASTESRIMAVLQLGDVLDVVGEEGDWYKIAIADDGFGYVNTGFVKVTSAAARVVGDDINIRRLASTGSEVLGTLARGTEVRLSGRLGDFYSFDYNGGTAFVHKDFVSGYGLSALGQSVQAVAAVAAAAPSTVYGLVNSSDGVNFRAFPSTAADIIEKLPYDEVVDIIEAGSEWHKVKFGERTGYIMSEFLEIKTGVKPDRSLGSKVVAFGKQFLGTRYSWGGTNLTQGVDCSGFTYAVYRNFGVILNRTSSQQVFNGTNVSRANLRAGDLVFFDTDGAVNGNISHVGIYIGGGDFIHASSSRQYCVMISNLSEAYYNTRYVAATRIFN